MFTPWAQESWGIPAEPQPTPKCDKLNVILAVPDGDEGGRSPEKEGPVSADGQLTIIWARWGKGKQSFCKNQNSCLGSQSGTWSH